MKKGFINILLYLFFPAILTSIFYNYLNYNNITYFLITTIPYILLIIYFIIKYKDEFINDFKKVNIKKIVFTIGIWLIGFLLMLLVNYIINYIIFDNGIASNEEYNRNLLFNHTFTYSIVICILIPILEEISFRLEFKKNIKNKYIFLILSSFLFSIMHLFGSSSLIEIIYFIPYFVLGLIFSIIYQKTDSIYMNILAHILHNIVCVIIILFF